jgi:hypothetical protein
VSDRAVSNNTNVSVAEVVIARSGSRTVHAGAGVGAAHAGAILITISAVEG